MNIIKVTLEVNKTYYTPLDKADIKLDGKTVYIDKWVLSHSDSPWGAIAPPSGSGVKLFNTYSAAWSYRKRNFV